MSTYESYGDVLSENATRRHVFGSSVVIVALALLAALVASVL